MVINIPDDILQSTGLSAQELVIEIAARLFDADKLGFHAARRLAALSRLEFENRLRERGIAIYRPRLEDVKQELREIREERGKRASGHAA